MCPEIILTIIPFPNPGRNRHPAVEAIATAADPERFPLQINGEGLAARPTPQLYYRGSMNDFIA
ncbi:MAG: hypothetical protein R3F19_26655 [Verrucomicrobiales bacterium]